MGHRTAVGLKSLQWFLRGITLGCSIVVLAIYGYFLATLSNHKLHIQPWVRGVEGVAGAATVYCLVGVLLLWCLAGHTAASFVAIVLDLIFIGCFLYIAAENRGGASLSCKGKSIRTPYGTASSTSDVTDNGNGGIVKLPSIRTACRLETACLAVSIIAIVFLLFAAINEFALQRNHKREKRFGPGPNNGYTSGSGTRKSGLFGRKKRVAQEDANHDTSALPAHAGPNEMHSVEEGKGTKYGNPQQNY